MAGRLIEAGLATPAEFDEHLTNLEAGRLPDLAATSDLRLEPPSAALANRAE